MKRIVILLGLIFLISMVVIIYISYSQGEEITWFIFTGDNFIPVGLPDKPHRFTVDYLKPTYWALMGVFILIYLKIIWKLASSRWQHVIKEKKYKVKVKGYGR